MLRGHAWLKRLTRWSETYREDGVFRLWLFGMPIIFTFDSKYSEVILSSSKHIKKGQFYKAVQPWLGDGLLLSSGEKWHERRKMLTPTFHFKILNDFIPVFNKNADIFVQKMLSKANNGVFEVLQEIQLCTLDIICETAMGTEINAQSKANSDYVKAVHKISKLTVEKNRKPLFRSDFIYDIFGEGKELKANLKIVHDFTKKVIADRCKDFNKRQLDKLLKKDEVEIQATTRTRMAFLDLLLHISDGLTKLSVEDIQEEVDTFMFEGHDTTAAGIAYTAYLVASDPAIQARIQEELDNVLGPHKRDITVEDIRELKYLECCIKEAMRIFPPVPAYSRQLVEDLVVDGLTMPKGTMVQVFAIFLHHDPRIFPDPEKFDPDRFLLENSKHRNPYSYVPFSAGPRNCIGQKFALMEEKVILAHLFRALTLTATQTREELCNTSELVLKPEKGILLEAKIRQATKQSDDWGNW